MNQSVLIKSKDVGENELKTTLKFPKDLFTQYRHLAIDRQTTVTDLIVEAMEQYIKNLKK